MNLKTKFIFISSLMIATVVSTAFLTEMDLNAIASIRDKVKNSNAQQISQMQADMMHDAIRADILKIQLAALREDNALHTEANGNLQEHLETLDSALADAQQTEMSPAIRDMFAGIVSQFAEYKKLAKSIAAAGMNADVIEQNIQPFMQQFRMLEKSQEVYGEENEKIKEMLAVKQRETSQTARLQIHILSAASILIACFMAYYIVAAIFRPQSRMIDAMRKIVGGETEFPIPYITRADEIGAMAKSVEVFKENALQVHKSAQAKQEQERHAQQERRTMMTELAGKFESSVQGIVNSVAAAATELSQTADGLTREVKTTTSSTKDASTAVRSASANIQSVAAALEEMSASVKEISAQVHRSNQAVTTTSQQTADADRQARALSEAAANVKSVLDMISDISSQIGLLALNATIESARAGDAGKGFAVVANEVKNLSVQTNKQLEQIRAVIEDMCDSTASIGGVIQSLNGAVQEVSSNSTLIAAAVEQQSATTNEISRNMQAVTESADRIDRNLSEVGTTSQRAEEASSQVLYAATELSRQAEMLDLQVKNFLQEIRSA